MSLGFGVEKGPFLSDSDICTGGNKRVLRFVATVNGITCHWWHTKGSLGSQMFTYNNFAFTFYIYNYITFVFTFTSNYRVFMIKWNKVTMSRAD